MRASFRLWAMICILVLAGCASDQDKTQKFLDKGKAAYEAGQYNEAVIQIKNAIEISPKSLEAHKLLTQVYLKQGDARQAFSTLLKIEQLAPDDLDNTARVASFYLLGRQTEEAQKRVDAVLAKNPDHIQALYLRAGLMTEDTPKLDEIQKIYEKILGLDPKETRAHLALARIFGAEGRFDLAETHLLKARELTPENLTVHKTLFDFYMSRQKPEDGLAVLQNLVALRPDQAEPHMYLGNFFQGKGDLDKAESAYKEALAKDQNNISALMHLARLRSGQGDAKGAEAYLRQALVKEPDNFNVKTALGEFHFSQNNMDQARQVVDEILKARPDFMPAKVLSGKLLMKEGQSEKAVHLFTDLTREEPESPAYHFLLGSALFEKGDLALAKASLAKAIEKDPGQIQARVILASIYFKENDFELARDQLKRVLDMAPDHYRANLILGNILMAQKDEASARPIFERLIQLDPANPSAFYRLGLLDRGEKKYSQAETHLKQALDLNPTLMDVFSALVSVYALQGQYDKALLAIDGLMESQGSQNLVASVLLNLKGNLLLSKNDPKGAEEAFLASCTKNPKYVSPYLTLAKLYGSRKDWAATEKTYQALIQNRPDMALAHGLLGSLYERNNQPDLAEAQYLKALDIDPDHIPALNNLAYLYAQQNRELDKALDLARQAKERLGRIPAIMDTLGWVYYKKGLFDSAALEFETCVQAEPQNPVFLYHHGLALHQLGKTKEAKEALKKALELNTEFTGAADAKSILDKL